MFVAQINILPDTILVGVQQAGKTLSICSWNAYWRCSADRTLARCPSLLEYARHMAHLQVMAASEGPAPAAEAACHEETAEPDARGEQLHTAAGLTEAQLMEVFKQTSIFNVRSALANNHALMSAREMDEANDR